MWSHYADNHKGVCLEFTVDDSNVNDIYLSNDVKIEIEKVTYSDSPLDIWKLSTEGLANVNRLLTRKSKRWNYEKEIRLIGKNREFLKFKIESVTQIIYGYRTSHKDRYAITRLFANLGYNFDLRLAKIQADSYEMEISQLILRHRVDQMIEHRRASSSLEPNAGGSIRGDGRRFRSRGALLRTRPSPASASSAR